MDQNLRTVLVGLIFILPVAPLMGYLAYQGNQKLYSFDKTLSPPVTQVQASSDHLALLVATAHQYRNEQPPEKEVSLNRSDLEDFKAHISNAGAQRGWLVQEQTHNTMLLTMPGKDLVELDNMAQDPLTWVSRPHSRKPTTSASPPVVNIILRTAGSDTRNYHILETATIAAFIGNPARPRNRRNAPAVNGRTQSHRAKNDMSKTLTTDDQETWLQPRPRTSASDVEHIFVLPEGQYPAVLKDLSVQDLYDDTRHRYFTIGGDPGGTGVVTAPSANNTPPWSGPSPKPVRCWPSSPKSNPSAAIARRPSPHDRHTKPVFNPKLPRRRRGPRPPATKSPRPPVRRGQPLTGLCPAKPSTERNGATPRGSAVPSTRSFRAAPRNTHHSPRGGRR